MIKTIIQAGFGNQLFQYATGYALAKRLKQQLVLDTSFFDYVKGSNADNVRVNNLNLLRLDNPEFDSSPQTYWKYRYGVLLRKTPFGVCLVLPLGSCGRMLPIAGSFKLNCLTV